MNQNDPNWSICKMLKFCIWKKTPDEFYREMFENEKKKLREEEEKSFDDSIGNWFRTSMRPCLY